MNKFLYCLTLLYTIIIPTFPYIKMELSNNNPDTTYKTEIFRNTTLDQTTTTVSISTISSNEVGSPVDTTTEITKSLPTTPQTTTSPTEPSIIRVFPPLKKPTNKVPQNKNKLEDMQMDKKLHKKVFCYCDIFVDECDVNCCCDTDCTENMLKIFDCHEKQVHLVDFYNQQGLPLCEQNEGWFCIFRDNSIKEKFMALNMNLKKSKKYSWPKLLHVTENRSLTKLDYYKVGDPIQLYLIVNEEISHFNIPFSISNPYCHIVEPIRHLNNVHQYCLMSLEKSQTIVKNLKERLSKAQLIGIPKTLPTKYNNEIRKDHININLFNCPLSDSKKSVENCNAIINFNETNEMDYINEIEINIYHNYTNLMGCNVYFYSKIMDNNINVDEIWQLINVDFKIYNKTELAPLIVSGPLGYHSGFPLIISKLILLNETADDNEKLKILDYYHPNKSKLGIENYIYSAAPYPKYCQKDIAETINFGEDLDSYCYLPVENSDKFNSKSNYTEICNNIQSEIFELLLNVKNISSNLELFISEFGYPRNNSDNWKKVKFINFEPIPVFGKYYHTNDSAYFICSNLIIGGAFEFLTARMAIENIHSQNVIEEATFEFYSRHNLHFQINDNTKFSVHVSAIFYDLIGTDCGISIYYLADLYKMLITFFILNVIFV